MKKDKEEKQRMQIAEGMTAIQNAVDRLGRYAASLDESIDAAALNNEDAYSDSLIEQKISVLALKSDFEFILLQLKDMVSAAAAFNSLKELPDMLDACNQIAGKIPNLTKLSKSMSSFRQMTKDYAEELKGLREKLSQSRRIQSHSAWDDLFSPVKSDAYEKRINAEKQARAARLTIKAAGQAAPAEAPKSNATDDIDAIMRGIEEEKGKK